MTRYRIDEGKYIFHEFLPNQKYNKNVWLDTEDKFQRKIETIVDLDGKEQNITAGYYTYYLPNMIDGKYLPDEVKEQEAIDEAYKAKVKSAILKAIDTMRVEVDGLAYDGNEPSQARMDRAIQTLVGDEPITWRMYNNSTETLTQTELGKALRDAGVMQTKLWFCTGVEEVEELVGADTEWYVKYSGGEA